LTYPELLHEKANNEGVVAKAEYGDVLLWILESTPEEAPRIVDCLESWQETEANIDWNAINQATTPEVHMTSCNEKAVAHFNTCEKAHCLLMDTLRTAQKDPFRARNTWQQHFVTNMFIRPETSEELEGFDPDLASLTAAVKSMRTGKSMV
jgi:ATP-dependent phosphoenolpyruvate carboxykinase